MLNPEQSWANQDGWSPCSDDGVHPKLMLLPDVHSH